MWLFDKLRNLGKKKKDTVKQTGNNQYGKVPKNTTKKKTTSPVPRNNNPAPVKSTVDKNTNTIIVNGTRYSDMTHTAKTKKQAKFENITHDITKGLSHDQIVSRNNIDLSKNWDKVDKKQKKEDKKKPQVNTYLNNPALKSTKKTVYNKRKELEKKEADRKEKERRAQRSQEAKLNLMSDKELEKLAKEYQNLKTVVKDYEKKTKKDAKKVTDLEILDADNRNEIQETYKARLAELEKIPGLEGYLKKSKQNRQEAKVEAEKHEVKQLTPWEAQTIVNAQRQGGADSAYVKKIMDTLAPEAGKKLAENTAAEWNRRPGLYGFEEGASLIDLQRYLEGITGQKIDADKAKQTAAHLVGEAGGMMAQSIATGAGLLSGEEVAAKLAGKSGRELLNLLGKAAGKTALTNAAVDAPINILQALKEVKESEMEGKNLPDGVDKTYNTIASGGKYLAENIEPGSDIYNVENKTTGNMNDWNQDLYDQAQEIARKNGKTPFFGVDKNGYLHYSFSEGGLAETLEYYNKAENPTYTLDYQGKSYENRSKGTFAKSLIANEALSALIGGAMDTAGIIKSTKNLNKGIASGAIPEAKPEVAAPVNKTKTVPKQNDIPDAKTGRVTPQNMTPDTFDRIAGKLESRSGTKIKTVDRAEINGADGMYQNGTIYIAKDATDPAYTVLKHELTHHIETSENYDAFQDFIIKSQKERGVDVNKELEELRTRYKNAGVDLEEGEEVREYVANFAQEYLFNSEESINRLARENPSLFRQIYDWIVDTVSKLTGDSDTKYLIEAQRKYEKALRTVKEGTGDAKSKYLYVKPTEMEVKAAEKMEAEGASPEEIKKKLNVHRGDDNNWRYETDDSKAKYYPRGDAKYASDPEYKRYDELRTKQENWYFGKSDEGLTASEQEEYNKLLQKYGQDRSKHLTLSDYWDNKEAYERNPELAEIPVNRSNRFGAYERGEYNRALGEITLRTGIDDPLATLAHDAQHASQNANSFAGGSSPGYWQNRIDKGESFGSYDKQIKASEKNMSDMMETLPEEYRTKLEDIWDAEKNGKPDVAQKLWDSVDDDDQYKEIMEEIDWELYALNDYKRNNRYRDANQLYRDTAGEIEARDTAGRLNLSEEERRNTMPKLGKDRAIFSEAGTKSKMFVGEDSKTADKAELAKAKVKKLFGVSDSDIWENHLWRKGADGKWKSEIDDSKMEFVSDINKRKHMSKGGETLGDLIRHDELFEAYPEIKDVKVEFKELKPHQHGNYEITSNTININKNDSAEQIENTILHEVQHKIQSIEGFQEGTGTEQALLILRRTVRKRLKEIGDTEYTSLLKVKDDVKLRRDYVDDVIRSIYNEDDLDVIAYKVYSNLIGEKEARATEKRKSLDSEIRRLIPPKYDNRGLKKGKRYLYGKDGKIPHNDVDGRGKSGRTISGESLEEMPIAGADSTRKGSQLQEKTPLGNSKPRLVDRHSSGQVGRRERSDNLRGLKQARAEEEVRFDIEQLQQSREYKDQLRDYNQKKKGLGLKARAELRNNYPLVKDHDRLLEELRNLPKETPTKTEVKVEENKNGYGTGHMIADPREYPDEAVNLSDMTMAFSDNIYSSRANRIHGTNDSYSKEAIDIIQKAKDNPNMDITIYRAVPKGLTNDINQGDWVTIVKGYAQTHGEGPLKGDYDILEGKVKAKDLYTEGNSIYEYGVWKGDSKQGTNLGITNKAGIPEAAKKQMKIPEAKASRDERLYNKSLNLYGEKTNKYIKKADVKDTASFNGEIPKAKEPVKEIPRADGKATAADKAIPGTKKAEKYERRQVRNFDDTVKEALGIVKYSDNKRIKNLTADMVEKLKSGSLTDADKEKLYAEMFAEGLTENESYVDTYKEVRHRIRNVRLQITDDIKNNITDYKAWRNENRHFRFAEPGEGNSRPVDTFYHSMQELHPDVFPDVNTQSEMLEELGKIANTYDDTYKRIEDMTDNLDEFYEYGKQKFYDAVDELEKEVNIVKRYKDSKTIRTYEEVQTAQKDIKKLKRKYEKLNDEIILTDDERDDLNKFVKGKITEEKLKRDYPDTYDKILTLAKAKKEYVDANTELKEIGAETRQKYADIADDFLQNSDRWNDKKMGFAYNRETPERNMIDVAGKTDGQRLNEEYFETIHQHEANANKMKQALRDEVKALNIDSNKKIYSLDGISADIKDKDIANDLLKIGKNGKSQKVSESAILQLYGEGIISKEGVRAVGANADKIERAALKMREIYNQLLDVANQEYMKHGYEPIEYRKDYFPHFEDNKPNGPIAKIADSLGIEIQKDDLPTDIAGLTHTFRPGRKWFGNALSRTGTKTEYDAIKGFDIYLEGISDVIHHTEDIQKLRSLENTLRYKYSDKGIRDRLDDLDKRLSEGEINNSEYESLKEKIYETGNTKLSNMAVWLRDYTDNLAGKKTMSDRTLEHTVGRTFYNATKAIEGRVAANMVAVNPGSWLTNFIPLTQGGNVSTKDVIRGMAETLQNKIKPDMLMDQSTFFVNRKGSDVLWKSNVEKVQDFMTKPMQIIDEFVSESMVRAKYNADIKKGIKDVDALRNADAFAAEVIADRSKGALPNVFNSKNPLTKILTMYQVEVNNQWSHLLKDIPRNADSKAAVALAFTNFAVGAYIFNDVYEELTGRRSAMDPISWVNDFMGDATGYKIPNFVEAIEAGLSKEKEVSFKVDKAADTGTAVGKLGKNIAQDIPYVGGLLEGGRVPISSALPKASVVIPDVVNMASGEMNKKKGLEEVSKELAKPLTYIVPPVGGGQAKKMIQAGKTLKNQGVYGYDKDGNKKLKYAVDRTPSNVVKGMLFGQYAMGNAKDYVDNFQSLDANKTSAYINMVQAGMKPTEAERYVKSLDDSSKKVLAKSEAYAQLVTAGVDADKAQKILSTIPTKRKAETMRKVILNSALTGKQKNIIGNMLEPDRKIDYTNEATYKYSLMTDNQKKKVDSYKKNAGISTTKAVKAYEAKKGLSSQKDQALALIEAGYSKKVIQALEPGISDNSYAISKQMHEAGITVKEYTTARKKANTNHNSYVSMDEAQIYLDKQKNMSRAEKYNLFGALTGCKPSNNRYR